MITVTYLPSGETSPLPNNQEEYTFANVYSFYDWVQSYACFGCLVDFYQLYDKKPETLEDWLCMGCGTEISIDDTMDAIDWDRKMSLSDDFEQWVAEFTKGKIDE